MHIRAEKCQGGLAVVVPERLAAQAGAGLRAWELADLELAGVTPENSHPEWAVGPTGGDEGL